MTDHAKPPFSPIRASPSQDSRKPSAPPEADPASTPTASTHTGPRTIVMRVSRPNDQPTQPAQPSALGAAAPSQAAPPPISSVPWTPTSGRPTDVHSDVQQTSTSASSLIPVSAKLPVAVQAPETGLSGRQLDVQVSPPSIAITVERPARTTKPQRKSKPKKKADLDERGRFRHTVRLDPRTERKLQAVAEILGVDMNAAISVCISVHHHRLTKPGGGDG